MKSFGFRNHVTQMKVEAQITAAIFDEAKRPGKQPSDMGRKDIENITSATMRDLEYDQIRALGEEGIYQIVLQFLGDKIAEVVWTEGLGRSASDADILRIGKFLRFEGEILECWKAWCDNAMDFDEEKASEFPSLARFIPLFLAQPKDATLGEIATKKSTRGDKLALSFLAWKEMA